MTEIEKKALSYLGLAMRAGRVVVGVPMICEALKKGKREKTPLIVLEAADTSPNTHKRITDRTVFYRTPHVRLTVKAEALAAAVGKAPALVGAVGVTEPQLSKRIAELFEINL